MSNIKPDDVRCGYIKQYINTECDFSDSVSGPPVSRLIEAHIDCHANQIEYGKYRQDTTARSSVGRPVWTRSLMLTICAALTLSMQYSCS